LHTCGAGCKSAHSQLGEAQSIDEDEMAKQLLAETNAMAQEAE